MAGSLGIDERDKKENAEVTVTAGDEGMTVMLNTCLIRNLKGGALKIVGFDIRKLKENFNKKDLEHSVRQYLANLLGVLVCLIHDRKLFDFNYRSIFTANETLSNLLHTAIIPGFVSALASRRDLISP